MQDTYHPEFKTGYLWLHKKSLVQNKVIHTVYLSQMEKAKEAISESVIKGTTRIPGKQLVIVISRSKETDGDPSGDGKAPAKRDLSETASSAAATDENNTEQQSSKVPRLTEEETNT